MGRSLCSVNKKGRTEQGNICTGYRRMSKSCLAKGGERSSNQAEGTWEDHGEFSFSGGAWEDKRPKADSAKAWAVKGLQFYRK